MSPPTTALATELHPVITDLVETARTRADAVLSEADRDAGTEVAHARDEAERILRHAELDGTEAATKAAVMRVARARRDARQIILTAQRAAYEALQVMALEALERRAFSPEGRRLGEHLETLVRARIGGEAPARRAARAPLEAVAIRGECVASIGPAHLVEQALQNLSSEVASLWA